MRYIDMQHLPVDMYNKILGWLCDDHIEYTYTMCDDDFVIDRVEMSDEDAIIMRLKLNI
jgi:hypothetical protein